MAPESPVGTSSPRRVTVALLRAAHPGPSLAVTTLVGGYGLSLGVGPAGLAVPVAAVLTGQLSIGWCNDLVDAARDRAVGRRDKPLATGEVPARLVRGACVAALAATTAFSLATGLVPGLLHLLLVAAGWAYDLGLKATVLSWLPYAVAFGGMPVFVALAGAGELPPAAVPLAAALLGVGAHLLNVLPDLADDEATGVRGLGHVLGRRRAAAAAVAALAAATLALVLGAGAGIGVPWRVAALGLVGLLSVVAVRGHGRVPFRAAIGIAAVDVLLLAVGS